MLIDYASLLDKMESLVERCHISENDYLNIATILKEHCERQQLVQTKMNSGEHYQTIMLARMLADADLALTQDIQLEEQRERARERERW